VNVTATNFGQANKPNDHTIEFNLTGLKSVNVNLTGPTVTLAAGSNMIITNPSPNVIRFQSTAASYSSCYQDSGPLRMVTTAVITALNTWTPVVFPATVYVGCPFGASNAPFTNTNCQHIINNPCQSGWAVFGLPPFNQIMFVVPTDGFVWKISLTVLMTINQNGDPPNPPSGSGDWSTPMYGLATSSNCATGVSIVFSMSMLAADNDVLPFVQPGVTRSWTLFGELTYNVGQPGYIPGDTYYLCFYNVGQGYPSSNAIGVYPTAVRVL
jgi:hypothetical protein